MRELFDPHERVFEANGKDLDAIKGSKESYARLVSVFGGVNNLPSSVLRAKRENASADEDAPSDARGYDNTAPQIGKSRDGKLPKHLRDAYYISGRGCGAGALSRFPQNVGRTVLLFYSKAGQTVYDPHAGHNSRMDLCVRNGRHYVACDISAEFMKFNRKRAVKLRKLYARARIELHECDAREPPVADGTGDFTITSPPYWDIEYYGDEAGQLGKADTYGGFMDGIERVLAANFRVLKPGAFAVWFVNDFRRKGKMYFYHADLIAAGENVGFTAHDILISDLGRSIRDCFPNQAIEQRILPKRHEYGIVFRRD